MSESRISPMLSYEDVAAAADWLVEVFGFEEVERFADESGHVGHCVLRLGDDELHIGDPGYGYVGPRRHAETCAEARRWRESPYIVDGVLVGVDDLDAHFERAQRPAP